MTSQSDGSSDGEPALCVVCDGTGEIGYQIPLIDDGVLFWLCSAYKERLIEAESTQSTIDDVLSDDLNRLDG